MATQRGRNAAGTRRRALSARAVIEQATGVLAQHTGIPAGQASAILRGYAERNGFVLAELASDVVAGRLPPGLVIDLPGLADLPSRRNTDDDSPGARAP